MRDLSVVVPRESLWLAAEATRLENFQSNNPLTSEVVPDSKHPRYANLSPLLLMGIILNNMYNENDSYLIKD